MTKLEYVLNQVCECTDETPESVMEYCPSDWFMLDSDNCPDIETATAEHCYKCWHEEKPE